MKRFLFLDFDGVVSSGYTKTFDKASLFSAWLRKHPDVWVIISSAWRDHESDQQLKSYFDADVRYQIIGKTPVLNGASFHIMPMIRQNEITEWLRHFNAGIIHEPFVYAVLDDTPEWFAPDWEPLVLCNNARGLTQHELDRVEEILYHPHTNTYKNGDMDHIDDDDKTTKGDHRKAGI